MDGRQARGQRTKQRLRLACRELIDQYEDIPLADHVCTLAECSKHALYYHFGTYEGLISEALALKPRRKLTIIYYPKGGEK